ncbi:MAG: hypothetical protein EA409_00730 [Saprospirales bacterium]|nr:MAG: hypothetical protein EA409_00730 [Saprospirales bacterium]
MASTRELPPNLHLFGIRHHGPGSAKSLKSVLESVRPKVILLECPADAASALDMFLIQEVSPPLSIMLHNPKYPDDTIFFPLAPFSPEWIALEYALTHGAEIIPFDLPAGSRVDFKNTKLEENKESQDSFWSKLLMAGIQDPESWWDRTIEEAEDPVDIFKLLVELLSQWRTNPGQVSNFNGIREAFMREELRRALKKNKDETIAVVCGAYHLPAIRPDWDKQRDKELLRMVKKNKMQASWIPWSYTRLSRESGYGAGVKYPGWYEHLYKYGFSNPHTLFAKMGLELRRKGFAISTARVLDATQMAISLGSIRAKSLPDLDEIKDAFLSTIAGNDQSLWSIAESEVLIGKCFGDTGPYKDEHPIERDFQTQLKQFRLASLVKKNELKSKTLDLRKKNHLELSQFLHRLIILGIPFGLKNTEETSTISSFKEIWELQWSEEYHITLVQAGLLGTTIEKAAIAGLKDKAAREDNPEALSGLIMSTLLSALPELLDKFTLQLKEKVTLSNNPDILIPSVASLTMAIKYGDVRNFDPSPIRLILTELIPKLCLRFPATLVNIDDQKANTALNQAESLKTSISILKSPELYDYWERLVNDLISNKQTHPLLGGFGVRQAYDRNLISDSIARERFNQIFSRSGDSNYQSKWLEGFLSGGMLAIFYDHTILYSLNQFISKLDWDTFNDILPVLRRIFSKETANDKWRLMKLLKVHTTPSKEIDQEIIGDEQVVNSEIESLSPILDLILE